MYSCLRMTAVIMVPGIVQSLSPGVFIRNPEFSMGATTIVATPFQLKPSQATGNAMLKNWGGKSRGRMPQGSLERLFCDIHLQVEWGILLFPTEKAGPSKGRARNMGW